MLTLRSTPGIKTLKASVRVEDPTGQFRPTAVQWADLAALGLLLILLGQLYFSATTKSATFDEPFHITRGLTYLRTGDLRMIREHPPLIDMLMSLPLAFDRNVVLPLNDPSWQLADKHAFADRLLWRVNSDGPSLVDRARVPIMALTLALAILIYAWSRRLYGPVSGLGSLTLLAFDPNVLANGCLATNDIGVTFFSTLAVFTFWRFLCRPGWQRAVITGVALGLALASKFSALFLIPAIVLVLVLDRKLWAVETIAAGKRRQVIGQLVSIGLVAGFTVWAVYGFQVGGLKGLTIPGQAYLDGILFLRRTIESGRPAFLLGSYSETGWWYYFPVALAVKTPIPTILITVAGLAYWLRRYVWRHALPLLIPPAIYLCLCTVTPLNIGYRHLLPVLPFLFILAGGLGQLAWRSRAGFVVGLMFSWLIIGTLLVFPHYSAYFNELVGGPSKGYRVLADSNLDWGQDLPGLHEYMTDHKIASVKLAYCGTADPRAYGINYELLPGVSEQWWKNNNDPEVLVNPEPGVYAISANNLQGARFRNHEVYAWFRSRNPEAIIGHSIFIYRVPSAE